MSVGSLSRVLLLAIILHIAAAGTALALTDLSGPYFDYAGSGGTPATDANNQYRLTGDTGFGWKMGTQSYNINLNGFTLTENTGGGNYENLSGALTGTSGTYSLVSDGSAGPAVLSGTGANTFAGAYYITAGSNRLELNKTAGVAAVSGPVVLASGSLQWDANNQVADASPLAMAGGTTLNFNGHSDSVGTLTLSGGVSTIALGNSGAVTFANSSPQTWLGQDKITGWNGSLTGGGTNRIAFGSSSSALTSAQLSQLYFYNPTGLTSGYYSAKILASGEIVPDAASIGPAYSWSGSITNPTATIGAGIQSRMTGDGTFGWQTGNCSIPIDLNGHNFTLNNGGGNTSTLTGAITGTGSVTYVGRADLTWEGSDNWLGGSSANTYVGPTVVQSGWLQLNKTAGVTAIPGNLQIGNGSAPAAVKLLADNQIADAAQITLNGGTLKPYGHSETVGPLVLMGNSSLDFSGGSSTLHFAASNLADWSAGNELLISNWAGSATNHVYVGSSGSALSAGQIAKVGFVNPAGQAAGLYLATLSSSGELLPSATAVQPINPPFDVSPAAVAARAAVYTSNGRANLSGTNTPLTAGAHISFFGDSITWLNGYVSNVQTALNGKFGTSSGSVTCYNDGINGGGAQDVLNGQTSGGAGYGGINPLPFATTIANQNANLAVVFIGVNDVWWRNTPPATFEQALRQIVAQADARGTKIVLATLAVDGELPIDGQNIYDLPTAGHPNYMDQFAQITRNVAATTDATLVDLRQVYLDYEMNNNAVLQLDGSLASQSSGILTYDGVHPTTTGNGLLADQLAQGLFVAARPRATRTWNGSSGSSWSAAASWSGGAVPYNDDPLVFPAGAAAQTNVNDLGGPPIPLNRAGQIALGGGYNISGGTLYLDAGITSSGTNTWGVTSLMNTAESFASNGGTLTVSGAVDNGGYDLTVTGSGTTLVSGPLSGAGRLIENGTGRLVLSGTDTYSGGTVVLQGTLIVRSSAALVTGSSLSVGSAVLSDFHAPVVGEAMVDAGPPVVPVPEPGTLALLAAGGLLLAGYRPRRNGLAGGKNFFGLRHAVFGRVFGLFQVRTGSAADQEAVRTG